MSLHSTFTFYRHLNFINIKFGNPRRRWLKGPIMRKYGYISQVSLLAVRLGSALASSHPLVGLLGGWGPWEMNTTKSPWILCFSSQTTQTNDRDQMTSDHPQMTTNLKIKFFQGFWLSKQQTRRNPYHHIQLQCQNPFLYTSQNQKM